MNLNKYKGKIFNHVELGEFELDTFTQKNLPNEGKVWIYAIELGESILISESEFLENVNN